MKEIYYAQLQINIYINIYITIYDYVSTLQGSTNTTALVSLYNTQ
jgi:hypothetical protein